MRVRGGPHLRQTDPGPHGFVWLGGRPALDLCNTRLGDRDLLEAPADLARWLREARLAPREPEVSARDLRDAQGLRDALRPALVGRDGPRVAALAGEWLTGAPGRLCVELDTLRPRFTPAAETPRCLLVTAVLDALDIAREAPDRVRECAAPRCPVMYLDLSRNRSRRWCSMERCGARAKATAYYRRHHG